MARVAVNTEILKWATNRSGKTDTIFLKFPNLPKWLNNESQPTLKQLESFAKATSTPLGYFFLSTPPVIKLPIPFYRTIDDQHLSNPSVDLIDTVQAMERRQAWMSEYYIDQDYDPLQFVGSRHIDDNPIKIAKEIREKLGLQSGWASQFHAWEDALRMLFYKVDDLGINLVVNGIVGNNTHRKLDTNEFRGFVLVDKYAPLIFINGADGKAAQMFTLAHELAHVWFGVSAAFDLIQLQPANIDVEKACNTVAAEFLVPETELREIWPEAKNLVDRFQVLARNFKVSEIVTARRCLDLSLIVREEFFEFYKSYMDRVEEKRGGRSGGNFYASQNFRIGRRFGESVARAIAEGKLQYNEGYRLTGISGNTFSEFVARLGSGGEA